MIPADIQSIDRGIVLLMAEWSGGGHVHRELAAFLEKRGFPPERLHVFDLDQHHREFRSMPEFAGKIHAWQETVVIRDGKVVYFARLGMELIRL